MDAPGETVSERVVWRVAAAADSDPSVLPPLYDYIEPDALDALVSNMADGEVAFTYAGYDVTVDSDGTVTVRASEGQDTDDAATEPIPVDR
jgi:hypothetical protein